MAKALRKYQHVDYSALLFELNRPKEMENVCSTESKRDNITPFPEVSAEKRRRDSLMSDRSMRYAYSDTGSVLHDRDCGCVAGIEDKHFAMAQDFLSEMNHCPQCYRKALVRAGLQPDQMKHINTFTKFFDAFRASNRDLETLFLKHQAQLDKAEPNALYLKVRDDKWFIREEQGRLALYHNNYSLTSGFCRAFYGGFHLQMTDNSFRAVVSAMCEYSWEKHLKKLKAEIEAKQKRLLKAQLADLSNCVQVKRFSLFFTYYSVLNCKWKCEDYSRKQGVHLKILDRKPFEEPYSKILCRVPKWEKDRFRAATEKIKDYCVHSLRHEYAAYCETELN